MSVHIPQIQSPDFAVNQLQQNISSIIEPLFNDLSGQFIASLSGCTTVPKAIIKWQRSLAGGQVTLYMPTEITGTSNTTTAVLSGLPSSLWPVSPQYVPARIYNNGVIAFGLFGVATNGVITLFKDADTAVFTAAGKKGVGLCSLTYASA